MCLKKSKEIVLMALVGITSLMFACTTLPKYPEAPKNNLTKVAHIKLISGMPTGFTEQWGGKYWNSFGIIPYYTPGGAIAFNTDYIVYIDKEWETSNDKWFSSKRFLLNDKAVFDIPSGEYTPTLYKITYPNDHILQNAYPTPFKFEENQNYEIYVKYASKSELINARTRRYSWIFAISDIKKVKEFKHTPGFEDNK